MVPATAGAGSGSELRPTTYSSQSSPLGAVALAVLALIGIGLAGYLTAVHYAPTLLVCSNKGLINCEAVLTSSYSVVPGTSIPITVPGLAFFLISLALAVSQLRRPVNYQLRQAHALWGGLGLLTALYLVFVEVMEVHNICLWCSCVHLTLLLTFLITLWRLYPKPIAR
ncbi:MAG TPA: vitamin K epoxide reductase family protein [Candidatus Dormibacteraeota bacterium]|nr:vitamin K epoxide reductase family protein [Candidatus Dormibacteraeota bacterium]